MSEIKGQLLGLLALLLVFGAVAGVISSVCIQDSNTIKNKAAAEESLILPSSSAQSAQG